MNKQQPECTVEHKDGALHKDLNDCYFCGGTFRLDKYGDYTEEVAELWNKKYQDTVLCHPDCTPKGIEHIQMNGEDPKEEWCMA